jgi:hypothetical protein
MRYEFAPVAGRMLLDDDGIQFTPDFTASTRTLRIGYEEIVHAVVHRETRDTVMVTDHEQQRHLFCVFSTDMAEGVAAIVRILVQRWLRQHPRRTREAPAPAGESASDVERPGRPDEDEGTQRPNAKLPCR